MWTLGSQIDIIQWLARKEIIEIRMATLQTNPMHEELDNDDEPITDLRAGHTILGAAGGLRGQRPVSLSVGQGQDEDIEPSWTGGLTQGCAPVFQPFGSPSKLQK